MLPSIIRAGAPLPASPSAQSIAMKIASDVHADAGEMVRMSRKRFEFLLELAAKTGQRAAQDRFDAIEAGRSRLDARVRRGLLRLWVALSGVWVAFCLAVVARQPHAKLELVAALAIGLPLGVLVASIVAITMTMWVWRGFRGGP
ncbi:MAG: hypothetical protein U1E60_04380 [Reyranellaceae bacterium]